MRLRTLLLGAAASCALAGTALAQTPMGVVQGQVWTPTQWNTWSASKMDFNSAGCPITSGCTGATTSTGAVTNLGLKPLGTSGATIPLNSTANTFSLQQVFAGGAELSNLAGGGTQCLQVNNTGVIAGSGAGCGGSGGSPGGSPNDVQFNLAGAFAASTNVQETGIPGTLATYGLHTISTNPDALDSGGGETAGESVNVTNDFSRNTPNFSDVMTRTTTLDAVDGINIENGTTVAKATFYQDLMTLTASAAGQVVGTGFVTLASGMGDVGGTDTQVTFGGAEDVPGGEGENFTPFNNLGQFNLVPGSGEVVSAVATYACSAVLTQAVTASQIAQTVTANYTGCAGPWAVADVAAPNEFYNEGAVIITATGSGTITGKFSVDLPLVSFLATQSGNVLTVTAPPTGGAILAGQSVVGTGEPAGQVIVQFGTGTGGTGTYYTLQTATVASAVSMTSSGVLSNAYKVTEPICNPSPPVEGDSIDYCGQDRVWIDLSQNNYATGTITGATGGASGNLFSGVGMSWNSTLWGQDARRPGCVTLHADDYTGGSFSGTSVDWYEWKSIDSTTSGEIYRLDVANAQSYHGLGPGSGSYNSAPCGRAVRVGPTADGLLAANQFILDVGSFVHVGDSLIQPNSPYPDVNGFINICGMYSAGGTYRGCGEYFRVTQRVGYGTAFEADGSAFTPTAGFPYAWTTPYLCLDHSQTCFYSGGNDHFGFSGDVGQTGYDLYLSNGTGTGTQGGIFLTGFQGPDLTMTDTKAASGYDCLQIDSSGVVSNTGVGCVLIGTSNTGALAMTGSVTASGFTAGSSPGLASKTCTINTANAATGITITITGGLITGTTTC